MIKQATSYSGRLTSADREHVEQLKEEYSQERADILARSRKLHQETNRRRKALAVKRKLEAAKEVKRRQEILARRRNEQREATDRFQRLGRPRELEEEGEMWTGKPSHFARQTSRETPVLEDALQAVRGKPDQTKNGTVHDFQRFAEMEEQGRWDRPVSGTRPPTGDRRNRSGSGSYTQSTLGPDRTQQHARQVAARAELQSRSFRQTSNSKSLFEKQLEAQQLLLIHQQEQSMHNFNTAVQSELETSAKPVGLEVTGPAVKTTRSDSLSSVDSLEGPSGSPIGKDIHEEHASDQMTKPYGLHSTNSGNIATHAAGSSEVRDTRTTDSSSVSGNLSSVTGCVQPQPQPQPQPYSTNNGGFFLHRSASNVAVVSPSYIQGRSEPSEASVENTQKTQDPGYFSPSKDFRPEPSAIPTQPTSTDPFSKHMPNHVVSQTATVNNASLQMHDTASQSNFHQLADGDASYSFKNTPTAPSVYTEGSAYPVSTPAGSKPSVLVSGLTSLIYLPHPPNAPSSRAPVTMSDMRAGNLYGNVNTHKQQYGRTEETEDMNHEEETGEGKAAPTKKYNQKSLKGILKKTKHSVAAVRGGVRGVRAQSATTYTARLQAQSRGRGGAGAGGGGAAAPSSATLRPASSASLRDSLDVTRGQLSARQHSDQQKIKKRTIRWADMDYSDEENSEEDEELQKSFKDDTNKNIQNLRHRQEPIINVQSKIPTADKTRPQSGTHTTSSPGIEPSVYMGPRKQFIRPSIRNALAANKAQNNNNHILLSDAQRDVESNRPGGTDTGRSEKYLKPSSSRQYDHQDRLSSGVTAADVRKSMEGAVYDSNGIRLDRTPTDDEINWLWDKVRSCLSRQSTMDSAAGGSVRETRATASSQPRQTAHLTSKYIDGSGISAQSHAEPARGYGAPNGYIGENHTTMRKKISMENLNTANRRAYSAGQLRSATSSRGHTQNNANQTLPFSTYQTSVPASRQTNPYQSPSQIRPAATGNTNEVVSDSIAEFLAAEEMASTKADSISDSQLQMAVRQRRQVSSAPVHHHRKVTSALSMEEQRLLESLERLDERLKAVEKQNLGKRSGSASGVFVPRPPPHRLGIRGFTSVQTRYASSARRRYGLPSDANMFSEANSRAPTVQRP